MALRVRTFFHQTFQVCHVYCNFFLGSSCRITINFGTLKAGNLLINIFASNNCFIDKNIFQNGVNALSKIDDAFLNKSWTFHLVRIIWLCSNFASLWHKHFPWNYKWNFRLPMSAFATVIRNILLEHQIFTRIFAFKLFHISITVANSISSKYYL